MTKKHQKKTNALTPRRIDVLLFDGVNMLDVAGPVQAFEAATQSGTNAYRIRYVALKTVPVRASCGLRLTPDASFTARGAGNDLLLPGGVGVDNQIADGRTLDVVQKYHAASGRMISVCSGALILAAAGVLDGIEATTHWSRLQDTRDYPKVAWNLDRISTRQGKVYTSAGATTGIDLALAIIRADCGPAVSLSVARELVFQLRRMGGQSQYAINDVEPSDAGGSLAKLLEQIIASPGHDWTLETMAAASDRHPRTLTRRFKTEFGETPAQVVEKIRANHARRLLEQDMPLTRIATESGFGDLQRLRRAFQRRFGVQPSEYRTMFA